MQYAQYQRKVTGAAGNRGYHTEISDDRASEVKGMPPSRLRTHMVSKGIGVIDGVEAAGAALQLADVDQLRR